MDAATITKIHMNFVKGSRSFRDKADASTISQNSPAPTAKRISPSGAFEIESRL
jgi:hypothetical protein